LPDYRLTFEDRVAIVTGAGGGLGRAYALDLAKRGAKVVVNDLGSAPDGSGKGSKRPADDVANQIKQLGGEAIASYDSVATPEGGENIVKTALDTFGKVDILINNAGILRDKSFIKLEPADWDAVMDVNLRGAYCVTRPAFKLMKECNYGRIILTTSAAAIYGNFGQSNYAAAKHGLIGLMNILKIEGAKHNIKINTIVPAAVTRLTEALTPAELIKKQQVDHVVPMVTFLCSKQSAASGNIYYAGMGVYKRAALVTGTGIVLGKAENSAAAEDIMDNFEKINSLKGAKTYSKSAEHAADVYKAIDWNLPDAVV
jgi:NAD(P)-dependent dehydrogenase (short-subunit alcohol dehydrogenase family)